MNFINVTFENCEEIILDENHIKKISRNSQIEESASGTYLKMVLDMRQIKRDAVKAFFPEANDGRRYTDFAYKRLKCADITQIEVYSGPFKGYYFVDWSDESEYILNQANNQLQKNKVNMLKGELEIILPVYTEE